MRNNHLILTFILSQLFFMPAHAQKDSALKRQDTIAGKSIENKLQWLIDKYSDRYTLYKDESTYPKVLNTTRYTFHRQVMLKGKTSFINVYKQNVYPRIYVFVYEYKTKSACNAAIDSLLQHFPASDGSPHIKMGVDCRGFETPPAYWILNSKSIIAIVTRFEHRGQGWYDFRADVIKTFAEPNCKKIYIGSDGPLHWE